MAQQQPDGEFWFEEQIHREREANRHPYSFAEDVRLEGEVKELSRRARLRGEKPPCTKGDRLWKRLEDEGLLPGRSWQSMKERWKRYIGPSIEERYQQLRAQGKIPAEQAGEEEEEGENSDSEITDESSDSGSESDCEEAQESVTATARSPRSFFVMDDGSLR